MPVPGYVRERSTVLASAPAMPTGHRCRQPPTKAGLEVGRADIASPRRPGSATRSARSPTSALLPPAPHRCQRFAQGRSHASAIKVDPDLYQHMDPKGRRQRHAHAGVRHWPVGLDRTQVPRTRLRPRRLRRRRQCSCARARVGQGEKSWWVTPSMPPTPPSSCCARAGRLVAGVLHRRVLARHHRRARRDEALSEATKIVAGDRRHVRTGEGNGPVNARPGALVEALAKATRRSRTSARRLQGAHPRRRARHRRRDARAHRDHGRHDDVDDDRCRGPTSSKRVGTPSSSR